MNDIGKKIRAERRNRGFTLEQIAEQTGLSRSYISNLERGLTEPTVSVLKKISALLQLSLVEIFGEKTESVRELGYPVPAPAVEKAAPRYVADVKVVEPDQRKTFTLAGSNLAFELLTPDLNRQFEVYIFRAEPGTQTGSDAMSDPPGEKFALVLKGTMETKVGDRVYTLKTGATIYFPSDLPHTWRVVGDETLEVVVVVHPPWF